MNYCRCSCEYTHHPLIYTHTMAAAVLPPARPLPPNMDLDDADLDVDLGTSSSDDLSPALLQIDESLIDRNDSTDSMAMLSYYKRLLPFKSLFTWLNRSAVPTRNFTHREFAFTLQNDVYIRYNSFSDWSSLKKEVVRLNPARFEIGPVYTAKPKDRKTVQKSVFKPVSRELVFDIDMTDYDAIRTCCKGKGICKRCWAFIAVAVEVLDGALREDFGFQHLLWVYSGRRGIHCWISDAGACELADEARRAIVGWLEVIKGGSQQGKKVDVHGGASTNTLHPSLQKAIDGPLKRAFVETVLQDQDCFREREQWELLLTLLPSTSGTSTDSSSESSSSSINRLRSKWDAHPSRSSMDKWSDVLDCASRARSRGGSTSTSAATWKTHMESIILQWTYPRIDTEVSCHLNHLLKSPFVVHPATGRVCVPLDVDDVAAFDPEKDCPTVASLLRELNASRSGKAQQDQEHGATRGDWEKTSLKKYVDLLDRHSAAVLKDARDAKRAMQVHSMDF